MENYNIKKHQRNKAQQIILKYRIHYKILPTKPLKFQSMKKKLIYWIFLYQEMNNKQQLQINSQIKMCLYYLSQKIQMTIIENNLFQINQINILYLLKDSQKVKIELSQLQHKIMACLYQVLINLNYNRSFIEQMMKKQQLLTQLDQALKRKVQEKYMQPSKIQTMQTEYQEGSTFRDQQYQTIQSSKTYRSKDQYTKSPNYNQRSTNQQQQITPSSSKNNQSQNTIQLSNTIQPLTKSKANPKPTKESMSTNIHEHKRQERIKDTPTLMRQLEQSQLKNHYLQEQLSNFKKVINTFEEEINEFKIDEYHYTKLKNQNEALMKEMQFYRKKNHKNEKQLQNVYKLKEINEKYKEEFVKIIKVLNVSSSSSGSNSIKGLAEIFPSEIFLKISQQIMKIMGQKQRLSQKLKTFDIETLILKENSETYNEEVFILKEQIEKLNNLLDKNQSQQSKYENIIKQLQNAINEARHDNQSIKYKYRHLEKQFQSLKRENKFIQEAYKTSKPKRQMPRKQQQSRQYMNEESELNTHMDNRIREESQIAHYVIASDVDSNSMKIKEDCMSEHYDVNKVQKKDQANQISSIQPLEEINNSYAQEHRKALEGRVERYQSGQIQAERQRQLLSKTIQGLNETIQQIKNQLTQYKQTYNSLMKEKQAYQSSMLVKDNKIITLMKEKQAFESTLSTQDNTIAQMKSEIDSKCHLIRLHEQQMKQSTINSDLIQKYQQQITKLKEQNRHKQQQIINLKKIVTNKDNFIMEKKRINDELCKEIQDKQLQMTLLLESQVQLKDSNKQGQQKKNNVIKSLQAQNLRLNQLIKESNERQRHMQTSMIHSKQQQKTLTYLQHQNKALNKEIQIISLQKNNLTNEIALNHQSITQKNKIISDLNANLCERSKYVNELIGLREKESKMKEQLINLTDKLKVYEAQAIQLKQVINKKDHQQIQLRKSSQQSQKRLKQSYQQQISLMIEQQISNKKIIQQLKENILQTTTRQQLASKEKLQMKEGQLSQKMRLLKEKLQMKEGQLSQKMRLIKDINMKLNQKDSLIKQIKLKQNDLRLNMEQIHMQAQQNQQKMKNQYENITAKIHQDYQNIIKANSEQIIKIQSAIQSKGHAISQINSKLNTQIQQSNALLHRLQQKIQQFQAIQGQIYQVNKKLCEKYKEQYEILQKETERLQNENKLKVKERCQLSNKILQLQASLTSLKCQNSKLTFNYSTNLKLKEYYQKLSEQYKNQLEKSLERLLFLQSKNIQGQQKQTLIQKDKKILQQQINKKQLLLTHHQQEKQNLTQHNQSLSSQNDLLKQENNQLKYTIQHVITQNKGLYDNFMKIQQEEQIMLSKKRQQTQIYKYDTQRLMVEINALKKIIQQKDKLLQCHKYKQSEQSDQTKRLKLQIERLSQKNRLLLQEIEIKLNNRNDDQYLQSLKQEQYCRLIRFILAQIIDVKIIEGIKNFQELLEIGSETVMNRKKKGIEEEPRDYEVKGPYGIQEALPKRIYIGTQISSSEEILPFKPFDFHQIRQAQSKKQNSYSFQRDSFTLEFSPSKKTQLNLIQPRTTRIQSTYRHLQQKQVELNQKDTYKEPSI